MLTDHANGHTLSASEYVSCFLFMVLLIFVIANCASTRDINNPVAPAIEIRVSNQNWYNVQIYVLSVLNLSGTGRRIATVMPHEIRTVRVRPDDEFMLRITTGGSEVPTSRKTFSQLTSIGGTWYSVRYFPESYACLEIHVNRYLQNTYISLC